jgi:hypothetical protein
VGNDWGVKLITYLHLVPRLRMMELYFHFLPYLYGVIKHKDNLAFFLPYFTRGSASYNYSSVIK